MSLSQDRLLRSLSQYTVKAIAESAMHASVKGAGSPFGSKLAISAQQAAIAW
ncbi:hypothetical protein KIH13_27860 [Pseudomonas viridiflava]|nr:hypothetical protein KIH13_27860 [Pseudomonas viridiflava]